MPNRAPGPIYPVDGGSPETARPRYQRCEWNPNTHAPASIPAQPGDCPNGAVISTGNGRWNLCRSCAALPAFRRYRKHVEMPGRLEVSDGDPLVRLSGPMRVLGQ